MIVRNATELDIEHWCNMRTALWPDDQASHQAEIHNFFSDKSHNIHECLLVEAAGIPIGFLELSLRGYAEGSENSEVPYVEGWFVDEKHRGNGVGRKLMDAAEAWATKSGYSELASDTEVDNEASIVAHKSLGFKETDRVVCFLKKLG